MNEYQEALNQLRVFEREYNFKIQGQVAPQENCDILQELVEKATPKKPIANGKAGFIPKFKCPVCDGNMTGIGVAKYCYHCGQALDWSGEDGD